MGTTTDETEQQPPPARPYWHLDNGDKRTLYVTFIGGLAANIGLVLVVGLGLLEAHLIRKYHHDIGNLITLQAIPTAIGALLAAGAQAASAQSRSRRVLRNIGVGITSLLVAAIVLGAVGYAAGVK